MNTLSTNVFVVLDESTLTTLKKYDPENNEMVTAIFESYDQANTYASEKLGGVWSVVPVKFEHNLYHYTPNMPKVEE